MMATESKQWMREFTESSVVYWTECLGEPTGNYYDSMHAAELEVAWSAAQKDHYTHPKVTIRQAHIHSYKLSAERWKATEPEETR
jgi:hypothetical protein